MIKQYRQNRTFQNNERKFYQQVGEDDKNIPTTRYKRNQERFWTRIWQPRRHNKKAEWINNMTKELGLEEGPKAEIHIDLLKMTLKQNIKLENVRL